MTLQQTNTPAVREIAERYAARATDDTPVDSARTTRTHAGEAIADRRNWPGFALLMMSLATLSGGLVAAADGFHGWAMLLFPISAVLIAAGLISVLVVRARVKREQGLSLTDPVGH